MIDVKFHWFDCSTSFDCLCGETEIYMDDETTEVKCKCGRVYKFICKLEVNMEKIENEPLQ